MKAFEEQAGLFRVLAHPVRLQILVILARAPATVSELVTATGHKQAKISQHLMILKAAKLVKRSSNGQKILYGLVIPAVTKLVEQANYLQ